MGSFDTAAWVSDGIALAALGAAAWSGRTSRSAKRVATRSEARADSISESLQEAASALQQMATRPTGSVASKAEPHFRIEPGRGSEYVLRNLPEASRPLARRLPEGITLGILQSHPFVILRAEELGNLHEVAVRCSELMEPVFVPLP